jgi:dodecin
VPFEDPSAFSIYGTARSEVMSIARIVEISSTSDKSLENAIEQGIARAFKTLRGIRSAWVKEQEVQVEGDKIVSYKVIMKITFVLEESARTPPLLPVRE